jgi:hypothetical protein
MTLPQLQTPIVLIIFNRPETTMRVFDAVRQVRPERLLVIADGPRPDRPGEAALCEQARAILNTIDWPCQVDTNYAAANMGCRHRVSSGLDWVFSLVEEAIILEDDCLPAPSFFPFCVELLNHYREEPRIAQISGSNFQFGRMRGEDSYFFSRFNHVWGWATWRRAWLMNDNAMADWPVWRAEGKLASVLPGWAEFRYWTDVLDKVAAGEIDSWACQWTLACWRHGLLTVLPNFNLISNIGFGPAATHTTEESRFAEIPTSEMPFPLNHPADIQVNRQADAFTGRIMFRKLTFFRKLMIVFRGRG